MLSISRDRLDVLNNAYETQPDGESVASKELRGWGTNNSELEDYSVDLAFPGRPDGLMGIIHERLTKTKAGRAIDIAGGTNGVALQDLLKEGYIGRALSTNYYDLRDDDVKAIEGLDHVSGDLLDRSTWNEILDWQEEQAPEGFDVVLHRPVGGLQHVGPADVYFEFAHLLTDMTKPGGVMLLQVPNALTLEWTEGLDLLSPLCNSLKGRSDIEGVIPSYVPQRSGNQQLDAAVLLKAQT